MTIVGVAPRGIPRHDARRPAARLRADHDAGADAAGFEQASTTAAATGRIVFARLKPGVIDRAGRAPPSTCPYHAIVNDVEAPLQKGMSEQTMARFKARQVIGGAESARGQSSVDDRSAKRRCCCCSASPRSCC